MKPCCSREPQWGWFQQAAQAVHRIITALIVLLFKDLGIAAFEQAAPCRLVLMKSLIITANTFQVQTLACMLVFMLLNGYQILLCVISSVL